MKILRSVGVTVIDNSTSNIDDNICIRTVTSSDEGKYDMDGEDSKEMRDMQKSFVKLDIITKYSEQVDQQSFGNEINKECPSSVDRVHVDCPLSVSFVKHLAERAHGMVGCDLLQAVKEAFFISLNRDIQKNILREQNDIISADVNELDKCVSGSNVCSSIKKGKKDDVDGFQRVVKMSPTAGMSDVTHKSRSISSRSNEKRISFNDEVEMESDTSYRPMNLISDYDSEENDRDRDGNEDEDEDDKKESGRAIDLEEQKQIIATFEDKEVVTKIMEQNYTSNVIKHHVIDKRGNSRVLLEEDLLLAFTRISPSALRSVRPVSIRPACVSSYFGEFDLCSIAIWSHYLCASLPLFLYSSASNFFLYCFSRLTFSPVFSPVFSLRLGKWPLRSRLFSGPILGA